MALYIKNSQKHLAISREIVRKITKKILSNYRISRYEICIDFVDNTKIRILNKKYLNHDRPTDVLTFPYPQLGKRTKKTLYADIAVSSEMAIENSKIFKTSAKKELCLYIIHGLLHALGLDDTSKSKRQAMRKEEKFWIRILKPLINKL